MDELLNEEKLSKRTSRRISKLMKQSITTLQNVRNTRRYQTTTSEKTTKPDAPVMTIVAKLWKEHESQESVLSKEQIKRIVEWLYYFERIFVRELPEYGALRGVEEYDEVKIDPEEAQLRAKPMRLCPQMADILKQELEKAVENGEYSTNRSGTHENIQQRIRRFRTGTR